MHVIPQKLTIFCIYMKFLFWNCKHNFKTFFERWCLPSCHQLSKSSEGDNVCLSKKTDRHTVQTDKIYSFVLILKKYVLLSKIQRGPEDKRTELLFESQ